MPRSTYIALLAPVDGTSGELVARDFFSRAVDQGEAPPFASVGEDLAAGDFVRVTVHEGLAKAIGPALARAGSAAAAVFGVAAAHDLDPTFSPQVEHEVQRIVGEPGIDDPKLEDMREMAFVTIDNRDSRDLDQAMYLERTPDGFRVLYALADAAYYVRPGTALFAEATKRGSTYYLPGFAVPMLPRVLSEDLVSLNPMVDRRAFVLDMHLDQDGEVQRTRFVRARIHSHAKLSYPGVQSFYDEPEGHQLLGQAYTQTLELLREVGTRRMRLAAERDVVRYRRRELSVHAGPEGTRFSLLASDRNDCERFNEQISLLCNTEGAKLFAQAGRLPNLQPIFRVHEPPHHRRVAELARTLEALCARAKLDPEIWSWKRDQGESLAEFLDRLPHSGPQAGLAQAVQRQALVINNRSEFHEDAAPHHGVGADAYARFSSPMREIVGIFTHKEAIELLDGEAHAEVGPEEEALQSKIVDAGNRSKRLQSKVTKAANKLAIDAVLGPDIKLPEAERPRRRGIVLGIAPNKAYVSLQSPPVEVKVYFETLRERDTACEADASLLAMQIGARNYVLGDNIELMVVGLDAGRWALAPVAPTKS